MSEVEKLPEDLHVKEVGYIDYIGVRFPHISERIRLLWGYADCVAYLESLLVDDRGGRQGFPKDIFMMITELVDIHHQEFPKFASKKDPVWGHGVAR